MIRSESNHSVFYRHTSREECIYIVFYVDDIVIISNDQKRYRLVKEASI